MHTCLSTLGIEMENHLRIALGSKAVALGLELGLKLDVIEDFAIERNQDKKRSEITKNLTVEEILDNDKKSFEIPYSNIEWIWLHPKTRFSHPKMEIKLKGIHLHKSKWDSRHEMLENHR